MNSPLTHLYAGADYLGHKEPVANTACGLRKAFVFDKVPSDVVESFGRVTCPACKATRYNGMSEKEFYAQQGKKA